MENPGGVKDAKKAEHWQRLIGQQRKSGTTIVAFCGKKGVSVGQFHWWNRRLREIKQKSSGGFVELVAPATEAVSSGVELCLDLSAVTAQAGGQVSVRLARGFDPETLKAVLAAIGGNAG